MKIRPFRHADEGGISEIHGQVAILLHQLAHPRGVSRIERGDRQGIGLEAAPERPLPPPGVAEEVHRFGERRPHGDQRIAERLQDLDARVVMGVAGVDQRDERSGVNEDAAHEPSG